MSESLIVILAVVLVLGIAINIHEFGHFIVAKIFGMRVEAYSFFGLGPRLFGFKIGNTDYRISAIPLGAYVKLYGDDATSSLEGGESSADRVPDSELYELRPRWQKFLVMLGGPFMNIVLAIAIPLGGALYLGIPAMPAPVVDLVVKGGASDVAGVQVGDRIVEFAGRENPTWQNISDEALISPEKNLSVVVERGGKRIPLTVIPAKTVQGGSSLGDLGLRPDEGAEPVVVRGTQPQSAAAGAGLEAGDAVISLNGVAVRNTNDVINRIRSGQGSALDLIVERNGQRLSLSIQPVKDSADGIWRIGASFAPGEVKARDKASIVSAFGFAADENLRIVAMTGRVFGQMFSGERSVKDAGLAGPVGIVQLIAQVVTQGGFAGFLSILAVISLNLGVFNLLPIPMLDGGQIALLGIDKVASWFGGALSNSVKEKINMVGLAIVLSLMVLTLYLDVSRLFF